MIYGLMGNVTDPWKSFFSPLGLPNYFEYKKHPKAFSETFSSGHSQIVKIEIFGKTQAR